MYKDRLDLYKKLETLRDSQLLVYVTGDRRGMETQISPEVIDIFAEHLDNFKTNKRISLFLYSSGGLTLAGWSIVNLIRQFCNYFEVIVPSKALSTATLICLGADKIVMTKQSNLGPVDPSVNTPLNPPIPGAPPQITYNISVEDAAGYFGLAKSVAKICNEESLAKIFLKLSDTVHPIVLGNVFRTREQIRMLATRVLNFHQKDKKIIEKIVSFVCSESGSHDYTINRREAREELKLPTETPNDELYYYIRDIYRDIREELRLNEMFDFNIYLGQDAKKEYNFTRAVIESIDGGNHNYVSKGEVFKETVNTTQGDIVNVRDQRTYEDWIYTPRDA